MRGSFLLAMVATLAVASPQAHAQDRFPDHLVRIVLPYTPGTGADVHTRVLAEHLSARWKVPVIVDNSRAPAARSARSRWPSRRPTAIP